MHNNTYENIKSGLTNYKQKKLINAFSKKSDLSLPLNIIKKLKYIKLNSKANEYFHGYHVLLSNMGFMEGGWIFPVKNYCLFIDRFILAIYPTKE